MRWRNWHQIYTWSCDIATKSVTKNNKQLNTVQSASCTKYSSKWNFRGFHMNSSFRVLLSYFREIKVCCQKHGKPNWNVSHFQIYKWFHIVYYWFELSFSCFQCVKCVVPSTIRVFVRSCWADEWKFGCSCMLSIHSMFNNGILR